MRVGDEPAVHGAEEIEVMSQDDLVEVWVLSYVLEILDDGVLVPVVE